MNTVNIDLRVESTPIELLIPYGNNARTHSSAQIKEIANSIKEFGFNDPIAIDESNVIIEGHGRLEAAKQLQLSSVPTMRLSHLTETQKKAYILAHNKIATKAGYDIGLLKLELEDIITDGYDVRVTGFEDDEIDKIINVKIGSEGLGDDEEAPAIQVDTIVKLSETWVLGNHRLRCGDSTNPIDVDALVNGHKPILMITDPPYGVNYDASWRDGIGYGNNRANGKVENDNVANWQDAYSLFTGDVAYIWHAALFAGDIATHLQNCNFKLVSQIIWAKQHFALSRGDYHWQHEPCWYAVRNGKPHNWQGDRKQTTLWEIANLNSFGKSKDEDERTIHSTQKPLECMGRPIANNTAPSDYVYDPFGGSGTTLIACEKLKRKCLMMELSPAYCDVIIRRWQKLTGKDAILESTGQTFKELENVSR